MEKDPKPPKKQRRQLETAGNPRVNEYFDFNREKKQSPANELTDQIIAFVKENGGAARRVNVQGRYTEGETYTDVVGRLRHQKGSWIPSGMLPGFEDIDAIKPITVYNILGKLPYCVGVKVAVEVKVGKDFMKEPQLKRREEVLAAGGFYIIAMSYNQFVKEWNAIHL
jgi:hypothetical protein